MLEFNSYYPLIAEIKSIEGDNGDIPCPELFFGKFVWNLSLEIFSIDSNFFISSLHCSSSKRISF